MNTSEKRFEAGWATAVGDFACSGRTYSVAPSDSKPWASGYRLAAARVAHLAVRMPAWQVLADLRSAK